MRVKLILLLLFIFFCPLQSVYGIGFHGIPGRYCADRSPTCCPNRDDECTVPILGDHLCYCDMFCDRGEYGNDCCPDFKSICRFSAEKLTKGQPAF
ncbi:unnamed protein product [Thelazia callipaeda]|uniref:SMB domain-containing protein n=1 Tax=Thelazia callipaeda TaxID=103827 RepID=A0A0N5D779_THECL|nr:unnamed protein product [Thelazia callipaeda]